MTFVDLLSNVLDLWVMHGKDKLNDVVSHYIYCNIKQAGSV